MASSSNVRAGGAYIEVFAKGVEATRAKLQAFAKGIGSLGTKFLGAGAALAAPLLLSAKTYAQMGDALEAASGRTGIAVESLSALKYAAEKGEVSFEDLEIGIKKMQQAISEGKISGAGLKDMVPEKQLMAILDTIEQIPDVADRAANAVNVFGRAGTKFLTMGGSKAITEGMNEAKRRGAVLTAEEVAQAAELEETYRSLGAVVKSLAFAVGAALGPALKDVGEWMLSNSSAVKTWINQHGQMLLLVGKLAIGFLAFGGACKIVAAAVGVVALAVKGLTATFVALRAAAALALAHPWVAAAAGTAVLVGGTVALATGEKAGASTRRVFREVEEQKQRTAELRAKLGPIQADRKAQAIQIELDEAAAEKRRALNAKHFEELRALQIAQIEDGLTRELAAIEEKYNKERAEAEKLGSDLRLLDEKRRTEEANTRRKYAKQAEDFQSQMEAEEIAHEEEVWQTQQELNDELDRQIQAAAIEAGPGSNREKELARLGLELQNALEDAAGSGADTAKIERLFAWKRMAIEKEEQKFSVSGTFSKFGLGGIGAGSDTARIRAAAETQLKKLDAIDRDIRDKRLAFG